MPPGLRILRPTCGQQLGRHAWKRLLGSQIDRAQGWEHPEGPEHDVAFHLTARRMQEALNEILLVLLERIGERRQ